MDLDKKRLERLYGRGKQNKQEPVIEYRSLTTYGWHIFRLCLNAILSSARAAHNSRVSALFISSEERLKKIGEQLRPKGVQPENRLRSVAVEISPLDLYRWDAGEDIQLGTVLGTGRMVIQTYLETKPQLSKETLTLMNAVIQQQKGTYLLEQLRQFERLPNSIRTINFTFQS